MEEVKENNPDNPKKPKAPDGLGRLIGMASAVVLVIAAFLPWGETGFFTVTGIDGDGIITIGIAVVAFVMLAIQKVPLWITIILGVLAAAIGIIDFMEMSSASEELALDMAGDEFAESIQITVGSGLYLTILAGVGLIAGPIVGYIQKRKK
ncbi:hypothetical protein GF366_02300 [Candidatus Peregrinibacteria bacterium]|nr:hypothetical protein [Candidatus Peregrinibacteria bacterium]